jgi:dTDP-4-dehydrorhamnose 3,5-epimerase
MFYEMTVAYHPDSARGVRWDDPTLAIAWPQCGERIVSERDRVLPLLNQLP